MWYQVHLPPLMLRQHAAAQSMCCSAGAIVPQHSPQQAHALTLHRCAGPQWGTSQGPQRLPYRGAAAAAPPPFSSYRAVAPFQPFLQPFLPFQQPFCPSYATLPHVFRVRIAPGAYEACSPKRLPSCFVWLRSDFIRDGVAAAQRFQNKLLMPVLYGEVLIKNPAVQQQMMQYAKAHHIQIVGANGADIGNGLAGHPTPYKWV